MVLSGYDGRHGTGHSSETSGGAGSAHPPMTGVPGATPVASGSGHAGPRTSAGAGAIGNGTAPPRPSKSIVLSNDAAAVGGVHVGTVSVVVLGVWAAWLMML